MLTEGSVYQKKNDPATKAVIAKVYDKFGMAACVSGNSADASARMVDADAFADSWELAKCPLSQEGELCSNTNTKYASLGPAVTCQGCLIEKQKDLAE